MGRGNRAMNWNSLFDEEQGETSADGRRGRHQQTRSGMGNAGDEDGDEQDQTIEEILHLHNSDHPGMVLVAAPLTGSNFLNWSRSIKRALGAKSKLELLDGTLVEPDPESKYYKRWLKVDYMISSWIINSISKDLVNSFTHFDTSKKLWEALNRRFNRSNGAKIAKLEKEIRNYEQGNQSVTEYFNNLTMLWNEMSMILPPVECVCAVATVLEKREEDRKLVQFMLGLNEIFEHTRSQILLMDPLPSLDKAYAMITQVEDEKSMTEIGVEGKPQMALYMQKQGGYRGNQGRNYQEKGPNWQERGSSWDRRLSKEEKARLKCTTCKQSGHEAHECFKTHGVPEWYKRYKEQRGNARVNYMAEGMEDDMSERSHSEKYEHKPVGANFGHLDIANIIQAEMAKCLGQMTSQNGNEGSHRADVNMVKEEEKDKGFLDGHYAFSIVPSMDSTVWIIDSGASSHVCCNRELMETLYQLDKPISVHLPDGSAVRVKTAGSVHLNSKVLLRDVLYVPGFTHNLISVAQLISETKVRCIFYGTHCVFHSITTDEIVGMGKMERNLYIMETVVENHFTHYFSKDDMTLESWHTFLGHPSLTTLRHMGQLNDKFKNQMVEAIERCEVCMKAKMSRDPFPILNKRSEELFELVHGDVWGPYGDESVSNTRFVLTLVEDSTRTIWTYLLSSKGLVCSVLATFINMVRTHFGKPIKYFRSDNGSEFVGHKVQSLFSQHGIIHQRTCVYTPQQNGVVERRHRTLLDSARALMFQSEVPLKFWPYAILTATWILNRIPSRTLGWKSPYSLLYGKEPDFGMLRPFGCLAYAVNMVHYRGKFDSRSLKCIFLGYNAFHKGYILYNLETGKLFISRDVKFFPTYFPYASHSKLLDQSLAHIPFPCFETESLDLSNMSGDHIVDEASQPCSPAQQSDTGHVDEQPVSDPHADILAEEPPVSDSQPLRRSSRVRKEPEWMKDFIGTVSTAVITQQQGTTPHTFPYYVSAGLAPHYTAYLFNTELVKEPFTYKEACLTQGWVEAMHSELKALEDNETWILTELPPGKKPLSSKWVYRIKFKADGTVDRLKARLVACGYNQEYGIDYNEVFSPVAKLVTVRMLIAVATCRKWYLHQLDVNNAFLHGFLHDDVYMKPPQGYSGAQPGQVCKLVKSLYGLKQASREWNVEFCKCLLSHGYKQSYADPCLFSKGEGESFIALIVYVDDVLVASPCLDLIKELKDFLHKAFTIKDLGQARYFLGMEIIRGAEGTSLNQRKYVLDILSSVGMSNAVSASTPFPAGQVLSKESGTLLADPERYRKVVGQLLYLGLTRPDLSYSVQQLSQFMSAPTDAHWAAVVHVLKYLKGTSSLGLHYPVHTSSKLNAYTDADWGTCPDSRKALTGFCIFLGESLVSWRCKKQTTVSASTAEAEYRALSSTTRELLWLSYLCKDLHVCISLPVSLRCDNQAAIHITKNPVFHERTKHLEIDCHLVREHYTRGFVAPVFVPSSLQLADFFTKSLAGPRFRYLLSKMQMLDFHASPS